MPNTRVISVARRNQMMQGVERFCREIQAIRWRPAPQPSAPERTPAQLLGVQDHSTLVRLGFSGSDIRTASRRTEAYATQTSQSAVQASESTVPPRPVDVETLREFQMRVTTLTTEEGYETLIQQINVATALTTVWATSASEPTDSPNEADRESTRDSSRVQTYEIDANGNRIGRTLGIPAPPALPNPSILESNPAYPAIRTRNSS